MVFKMKGTPYLTKSPKRQGKSPLEQTEEEKCTICGASRSWHAAETKRGGHEFSTKREKHTGIGIP